MKTFVRDWNRRVIEDWGCENSPDVKKFAMRFRKAFQKSLPEGYTIENFNVGHYDIFLFVKFQDKFVYISYSIPRDEEPLNFDDRSAWGGVLYRTALHPTDYHGGTNNFSTMRDLTSNVVKLMERQLK